ncbi:hypothetical protein LINPERPRIM_LOCUS31743 [Linum perenne]
MTRLGRRVSRDEHGHRHFCRIESGYASRLLSARWMAVVVWRFDGVLSPEGGRWVVEHLPD